MDLRTWSPRIFAIGCFLTVTLVMANNLVLNDDPSPATSWGTPTTGANTARFDFTYQLDPGDRISVDVAQLLQQFGYHYLDGYTAYLVERPGGSAGAGYSLSGATYEATGRLIEVDEPTRKGLVIDPPAPTWTITSEDWVTLVLVVDHRNAPADQGERQWWAKLQQEKLLSDGHFGPENAPIQVLTASARAAQPWVISLQVLGALMVIGGAAGALIGRTQTADTPSGLAAQATQWLGQLRDQTWVLAASLLAIIVLLLGALESGLFDVHPSLQPGSAYGGWTTALLLLVFLSSAVAIVLRMIALRRSIRVIPELNLDA